MFLTYDDNKIYLSRHRALFFPLETLLKSAFTLGFALATGTIGSESDTLSSLDGNPAK